MFVLKAASAAECTPTVILEFVCLIRHNNNKRGEKWNYHLSEVCGVFSVCDETWSMGPLWVRIRHGGHVPDEVYCHIWTELYVSAG